MFQRLSPLFPYLKRYWRNFALGGLSLILYNGAKAMVPLVVGSAIDDMRHGLSAAKVEHHSLLLLGIATVSGIFLYLMRQIIIGASREIEYDLRNDLFAHLELQPPSFFQQHRTGDIMARSTNDLNAVRQLLGPAIMYSANTIFFTAVALPFMLRISPWLTLCAFVPLPFASVLVQYFGARIHTRFERIQAMFSDISAQAEENFSGARLIRAFAQEEAQIAAFEESNREYIRRSLLLARLMAMLWPTLEFFLGFSLMLTLFVGGREVVLHHMSVGQFTTYNVYMVQLIWPMIAVGWVVNLVQRGAASVVRIDQLMKQQPAIDDSEAKPEVAIEPVAGSIEFNNLSFAYTTGGEVLHNISLEIPAGSSLAIVGPTGSGKSTLVSLIPRLQEAAPGMVLIDGRPIREFTLASLRHAIGFVPQETFLFSTTIADNIAFGVPKATEAGIEAAARTAHIGTEILEFPQGFATVVGERGMTLSGGQKQRTAIARAVLRDPRILILDDALASVDTYTEEQILSGLRTAMQGRTTILIAHRVSTARNADRIAVLVDGRIAELGTHDELLARGGYYNDLYEKQSLEEEILTA
ncbi:ABC transporter ATP-binding protein [Granulicella mallensis]|uniref:ATP-binding cassette subfamily B protein n=1 Tax=Granulicella mallensis TaxID=940614 RepID=A0A7W8ECM5_9BACT|nr:ABC transporter ATP-binding protein [Granulicella mallensis]MBB5066856.1 ATP-binding cassette subfamily B protein [Granulicella mallensis]